MVRIFRSQLKSLWEVVTYQEVFRSLRFVAAAIKQAVELLAVTEPYFRDEEFQPAEMKSRSCC